MIAPIRPFAERQWKPASSVEIAKNRQTVIHANPSVKLSLSELQDWLWERAKELGGEFLALRDQIIEELNYNVEIIDPEAEQETMEYWRLRYRLAHLLYESDEVSKEKMKEYFQIKRQRR